MQMPLLLTPRTRAVEHLCALHAHIYTYIQWQCTSGCKYYASNDATLNANTISHLSALADNFGRANHKSHAPHARVVLCFAVHVFPSHKATLLSWISFSFSFCFWFLYSVIISFCTFGLSCWFCRWNYCFCFCCQRIIYTPFIHSEMCVLPCSRSIPIAFGSFGKNVYSLEICI